MQLFSSFKVSYEKYLSIKILLITYFYYYLMQHISTLTSEAKSQLVSPSYYTNDILLRSPTLQPYLYLQLYDTILYQGYTLYYTRTCSSFLSFTGLDKREVRERDRQGQGNGERLFFPTTFFRFLLVENDFLVQKS